MMNENNSEAKKRPFSLALYILIVFGLSWPFTILAMWGILPLYPVPGLWFFRGYESIFLFSAAGMIMVTVGTYISGRYVFGDGFAYTGWRWGKPVNYLAIIAILVTGWVLLPVFEVFTGVLPLPEGMTGRTVISIMLLVFVFSIIPGFGEEFGWRGYMLPQLARRYSYRKAILVTNLVWWAWHFPALSAGWVLAFLAGGILGFASNFLMMLILVLIGEGVIFAWIWASSRSIAVASVWHAGFAAISQSVIIAQATVVLGSESLVVLWPLVYMCILGVVLLWKGNWSYLQEIHDSSKAG